MVPAFREFTVLWKERQVSRQLQHNMVLYSVMGKVQEATGAIEGAPTEPGFIKEGFLEEVCME